MSVSRRFIITELKTRKINPGTSLDYNDEIFKFLLETFNLQEEVLEEDKDSLDYLKKVAKYIGEKVKEFMNLGSSKPTIRLDRILAPKSNHKVLKH